MAHISCSKRRHFNKDYAAGRLFEEKRQKALASVIVRQHLPELLVEFAYKMIVVVWIQSHLFINNDQRV